MTYEKLKGISISTLTIFGLETFSIAEIDAYLKIICQLVITACTVYYLLTKTKQLKK